MNMHADEKSDEGIVPQKQPNNGDLSPAEAVEGRTSPKGNGSQTAAVRIQSRGAASNGLTAVLPERRNEASGHGSLRYYITSRSISWRRASTLWSGRLRRGSMV